jgi:3-hydroxyacyl-CoA dehydrogenase
MEKRAPQFKGVEMAALDTGRTVAVIGSGAMGAGIAQVAAVAGYTVRCSTRVPRRWTRRLPGSRRRWKSWSPRSA